MVYSHISKQLMWLVVKLNTTWLLISDFDQNSYLKKKLFFILVTKNLSNDKLLFGLLWVKQECMSFGLMKSLSISCRQCHYADSKKNNNIFFFWGKHADFWKRIQRHLIFSQSQISDTKFISWFRFEIFSSNSRQK